MLFGLRVFQTKETGSLLDYFNSFSIFSFLLFRSGHTIGVAQCSQKEQTEHQNQCCCIIHRFTNLDDDAKVVCP